MIIERVSKIDFRNTLLFGIMKIFGHEYFVKKEIFPFLGSLTAILLIIGYRL